ncbi:MAG: hypothetical protein V3U24_06740 [Candidatus Neomarinimicrobiota bacterium]
MPKREKSSDLWKARSLAPFLLFFLFYSFSAAQEDQIIMLSTKVGTTLDAEEKEILGLFPRVDGFQSAQFFEIDENKYLAKIIYLDQTRPRVLKRYYSWRQFQRLRYVAGSHPEITDEMRAEHRYKLSYLSVDDMLEQIPRSTYCSILHTSGRRIRGSFVGYQNRIVQVQSPTKRIQFPVREIESISYRPSIYQDDPFKKAVSFAAGVLLGILAAEVWNISSEPSVDGVWQNRFAGMAFGLVTGSWLFRVVNILTSPREFITISAEEMAKLR